MKQILIIKIGGNIIDNEEKLLSFLKMFAQIDGLKILVHGGGKIATRIGDKLGIESKYIDGRRVTDAETIDLVTMVYAGLVNKKIVARLQSLHCNAIGISGADGNLIPATKRLPVPPSPERAGGEVIDFGFVGDVLSDKIDTGYWIKLLDSGFAPVASPITHDGAGNLLNTNADTIAQEIAKALSKAYTVNLIYGFEKKGVLLNVEDDASVVGKLAEGYYLQLKEEGRIFAGMLPKIDNAFAAVKSGVAKVVIGLAEELPLLIEGKSGTTIE